MKMSLVTVVEQVVNDKVQNGEMFTAHDVTLEVRSRGHRAGHAEIRTAVHDYFNRGGMGVAYNRSTITVPGGTPFLYHRLVDDPSTFANVRGLNTSVSPTSATITVPPLTIVDDEEGEDDDEKLTGLTVSPTIGGLTVSPTIGGLTVSPTIGGLTVSPITAQKASNKPGQVNSRQVDERGTLSIPTNLVRGAGLSSKQKVYAFSEAGTLFVGATKPSTGLFHEYTVDRNDQIRITQKCLQDAGIPGKTYNLELNANSQILVKAS